jgi:hypothetical protein
MMTDYRGPYDSEGMRLYLMEDSLPSVSMINTQEEMRTILSSISKTIVLGFFPISILTDMNDELDGWQQYQIAADNLRGHASFFGITSTELKQQLGNT